MNEISRDFVLSWTSSGLVVLHRPLVSLSVSRFSAPLTAGRISQTLTLVVLDLLVEINTLRPRQNGRHFTDDIFKCIFLNENVWIPIKISMKFVPRGPINNIPALVQIMAWCRPGDKPLSEPMIISLPTHICVTRPQWVNVPQRTNDAIMMQWWCLHYVKTTSTTSFGRNEDVIIASCAHWDVKCIFIFPYSSKLSWWRWLKSFSVVEDKTLLSQTVNNMAVDGLTTLGVKTTMKYPKYFKDIFSLKIGYVLLSTANVVQ